MSAVRTETGLETIAAISIVDGASMLQTVETTSIRTTSGLSVFFSAMDATASEPSRGFGNSSSAVDITTGISTATVTGGVSPFTYLWEEVSSSGTWNITDDTGSFTSFQAESVAAGDFPEATFKCTVTDANGAEAVSNIVTARAINLGGGF